MQAFCPIACFLSECACDLAAVCETLLAEIGGVLGKMHDSGTIHGNLSPANILIRNIDQAVVSRVTRSVQGDAYMRNNAAINLRHRVAVGV